ncbi:hypothetical protein AMTRI_Chr13g118650 [Amborella trichopoda]
MVVMLRTLLLILQKITTSSLLRSFSLFFFFLPTFSLPTLENAHFSPENTIRGPRTISVMYALKEEENHLSKELETHQSFKLLTQKEDNENSLVLSLNTIVDGRIRILKSGPVLTKGYRVMAIAPDFDYLFRNTDTGKWSSMNNVVMALKELGVSDSSGISWSPSLPLIIFGERGIWTMRERRVEGEGVWVKRERECG